MLYKTIMLYFIVGCGLGAYVMSLYHSHDKNLGKVTEHLQKDGVYIIEQIKRFCASRK